MRYDINNEPMETLKCLHCGNEMCADQLPVMVDGLKMKGSIDGHFNKLTFADNMSICCKEPYYEYA